MTISACSPSPRSRRKVPTRSFQCTRAPGCHVGGILAAPEDDTLRLLRWLALRGSPPGNRALPDMSLRTVPLLPGSLLAQGPDLIQLARRGCFPLRGLPRRGGLAGAARLPGASGATASRGGGFRLPEPRFDQPADRF